MKLNRRTFLQMTAATGAAAATSSLLPGTGSFARAQTSSRAVGSGKWVSTTCQGCTSWCPAQAYVQDGRVTKVRGNPHSKATHGDICPRPHLAIQQMYDPDRVKVPMKRTNPRKGRNEDPEFVAISWDEAMDMLADKIMELRKDEETEKLVVFRGRYSYMRPVIYYGIPKIVGSPNNISHSAICAEGEKFGSYYTEGNWDYNDFDLENTRYVLALGTDPVASNRMVPHAISLWGQVRDRAKMTVVDPRYSATASKAHRWVPIIPGEDGALVLAIAHIILTEGGWYKPFVGDFHDGVNRFVTGEKIPESMYVDGQDDPVETFSEIHGYGLLKWWNLELFDKTPEWAADKVGIPVETIYEIAHEMIDAAPKVISWVSPGVGMQVRGGYSAMAGHALNGLLGSIDNVGGVVQKNSPPVNDAPSYKPFQDDLAKKHSKYTKIDQRGYKNFLAGKKKPGGGVVTNNAADGILSEDPYKVRVVIGYWNNFTYSCTGAERWEKAMSKVPFFAHITTNYSEMSHFADLLLPAAFHMFEKYAFLKAKQNLYGYASVQQQMVEPLWDVRQDETEIPWMLAEALERKGFPNLLNYYKTFKDPETGKAPRNHSEFALYALKHFTAPCWDGSGSNKGESRNGWQDFLDKGVFNTHRFEPGKKWSNMKTDTKKFEYYSETLKSVLQKHADNHNTTIDDVVAANKYTVQGDLAFVPHYEEPFRHGSESEFPLLFNEHRSRLNREGRSQNVPWYYEIKDVDPGDERYDDVAKLNPETARQFGVRNGDRIRITSPVASIEATVKEWEGIRPGMLVKCFGQGHWAYGRYASKDFGKTPRGGSNNHLIPCDYEHLSGSTARHGGVTRVRIEKL